MGLRDRLKNKLRNAVDRLSGEHSAVAPETVETYSRPGQPNDDAEVVMARLNRPGAAGGGSTSGKSGGSKKKAGG